MIGKVKKDILAVFDGVIDILEVREEQDIAELSELSNHVIHNASIYQDQDSISIAILMYSIYKVIQRVPYLKQSEYSKIFTHLKNARTYLQKDVLGKYNSEIESLFNVINKLDNRLKNFIEEVVTKAKINKGTKLVEHGLTIRRAASLMGISQWELMSYFGKTEIVDAQPFIYDIKKRMKFARGLFK